jgi:hypothetical protein
MDTQLLLTVMCVVAAGAWIVRRIVRTLRGGSSGCGACATCPAGETPARPEFVPLERLVPSAPPIPAATQQATSDEGG